MASRGSPTKRALSFLTLTLILACSTAVPLSAQCGATFREDGDFLYLENDAVQFAFSKTFKGGLDGVVDRGTGIAAHPRLKRSSAVAENLNPRADQRYNM